MNSLKHKLRTLVILLLFLPISNHVLAQQYSPFSFLYNLDENIQEQVQDSDEDLSNFESKRKKQKLTESKTVTKTSIFKAYENFFNKQWDEEVGSGRAENSKKERDLFLEKKRESFRQWYLAHFFFDRKEILLDNLKSEEMQLHPATRYRQQGEDPFSGYLAAINYIKNIKPEKMSIQHILEIHRRLTSKEFASFRDGTCEGKNSEGMDDSDIGQFRFLNTGEGLPSLELHSSQGQRIFNGETFARSPKTFLELEQVNPLLKLWTKAQGGADDRIWYTPLSRFEEWKSDLSAETYKKIKILQGKTQNLDFENKATNSLRALAINDLVQFALKRLQAGLLANKGDVNKEKMAELAADFYHRFLSIHPFINGNGRVARLIIQQVFESQGMLPPLFTHWGEDVFLHPQDFRDLFKDSLKLSKLFHQNLSLLGSRAIDYQSLPTPYLTPEVIREFHGKDRELINPEEFMTWVRFQKNIAAKNVPGAVRLYLDWKKSMTYEQSPADQNKVEGSYLIPPSFTATFGKIDDKMDVDNQFINQFYDSETSLFRGFPGFEEHLPSDKTVLSYFSTLKGPLAGMSLEEQVYLTKDFEKFNEKLVRRPLELQQSRAAHARGYSDAYMNSCLASFSYSQEISESFAKGHCHPDSDERTYGTLVKTKKRKIGVIDDTKKSLSFPNIGMLASTEKEVMNFGHTDPAAIDSVFIAQAKGGDSLKFAKRSENDRGQIDLWSLDSEQEILEHRVFNKKKRSFSVMKDYKFDLSMDKDESQINHFTEHMELVETPGYIKIGFLKGLIKKMIQGKYSLQKLIDYYKIIKEKLSDNEEKLIAKVVHNESRRAVREGKLDILKNLMSFGGKDTQEIRPNWGALDVDLLLQSSSFTDNIDVFKYLLSIPGMKPEAAVLFNAAFNTNKPEMIKVLLDHPEINENIDIYSYGTPLIRAIRMKANPAFLQHFINSGKKFTITSSLSGYTPLEVASMSINGPAIDYLLTNYPEIDKEELEKAILLAKVPNYVNANDQVKTAEFELEKLAVIDKLNQALLLK